jgi:hypothetical protein
VLGLGSAPKEILSKFLDRYPEISKSQLQPSHNSKLLADKSKPFHPQFPQRFRSRLLLLKLILVYWTQILRSPRASHQIPSSIWMRSSLSSRKAQNQLQRLPKSPVYRQHQHLKRSRPRLRMTKICSRIDATQFDNQLDAEHAEFIKDVALRIGKFA